MCCKCCGSTQRKIWVYLLGVVFIALGLCLLFLTPSLVRSVTKSKLQLKRGSMGFENWVETPFPVYYDVYMFNWTNPDEVQENGTKPHFEELGPYVFLDKRIKDQLKWNKDDTLSFNATRTWYFQPKMSNGSVDDLITTPNIVSATVLDKILFKKVFIKKILNHLLNEEGGSLAIKKTVQEIMFDGYEDPILDFAHALNSPIIDPPKTFGYFEGYNDTRWEGEFTVRTGQDSISNLGALTGWEGKPQSPFFPGECGNVNGSLGDIWPPYMETNKEITFYILDIGRYLNLVPGPTYTMLGLEGQTWVGNQYSFGNVDKFPNTECFCSANNPVCPPSGVVDIRKPSDDTPLYASFPHFLHAEPIYGNAVSGLEPNEEKHSFTIVIEPTLGIPMKARASIQINMQLQPDPHIDIYKNIPKFMAPVFWIMQRADLPKHLVDDTKDGIRLIDQFTHGGQYTGIGLTSLGAAMLIIGMILSLTNSWGGKH